MPAALIQMLRSRWFSFCLHACLWVLLYLSLKNLGGRAPDLHEAVTVPTIPQTFVPVTKIEPLFLSAEWPKPAAQTNTSGLFFTRHFVPPPTPAPPPPPTTRKIEVIYQGYFQAPDAPKCAVLKIADAVVVARVGILVETNLFLADANMQTVTLTNTAAQVHVVPLNTKKEIEIPIR